MLNTSYWWDVTKLPKCNNANQLLIKINIHNINGPIHYCSWYIPNLTLLKTISLNTFKPEDDHSMNNKNDSPNKLIIVKKSRIDWSKYPEEFKPQCGSSSRRIQHKNTKTTNNNSIGHLFRIPPLCSYLCYFVTKHLRFQRLI